MNFPNIPLPLVLANLAEINDTKRGYTFVAEDGKTERYESFTSLYQIAGRYAAAFQRLGLRPGERVAMIIPEADDFVFAFFGAMHAGLVPVPMCPPMSLGKLGNYLESARHIVERAEAAALVCSPEVKSVVGSLLGGKLRVVVDTRSLPLDNTELALANLSPSDPCFVQFTSGSTSRPKGVVLTHGNLAANAHCIMNLGLRATPEDVGCTWLPFYHDMGLIGFVLAPLVTATPVAFMQPLAFLKRPLTWFELITRHRGSIGFGPNFAYGLCTTRIKEEQLKGIDLSSWRVAGCGAEPIHRAVLDGFCDRFEQVGFDRNAMMPCFGMAESTLAVTFHNVGTPYRTDRVDLSALAAKHEAQPVAPERAEGVAEFVSCGRAFGGHEVGIVDEAGQHLGERAIGEVVLRGPSVMVGYFNDPEASSGAMRDGWLHTGDKGYLADGELFICGRIKDMIIVAGRNYYPTDIEWACNEIPGIRKGNVVAFGLGGFGDGPERVVVAAESKATHEQHAEIEKAVKARVLQLVGVKVDEVLLLEPGALPKTSSGKLQRRKTRQMYLDDELKANSRKEGRIDLMKHLAVSQFGFLRNRVRTALGANAR